MRRRGGMADAVDNKTENKLAFEDKRYIAFSAAQAWGADI